MVGQMRKAFLCIAMTPGLFLPAPILQADQAGYELRFSSGIAAINSLDFLGAIKEFESALKEKPSDIPARFYLGYSYNRLGKQAQAIALLRELVKEKPDYPEAREELGIAYYYAGNYPQAIEAFDQARAERPESASSCYYSGLTYLALGNFEKAETLIADAAKLDPSNAAQGRYQMGLAYLQGNRTEEAIQQFELSHQLLPESEEGMEAASFAQSLRQRKKVARIWGQVEARYEYDSNVVLMPDDGDVLFVSNKDDFRYMTTFTLNYNQPVKDILELDGRYRFVQSVHHQIGDYNMLGNDLLNGVKFNLPHSSPFVGYRYEYYFLDDCKASFLRSNTVIASFTIPETSRALTIPYYHFRKDDYLLPYYYDEDNRDAFNHIVGFDQYFMLSRDAKRWVRGGVSYDRNAADGINYVYDGFKLSGEFSTPLACEVFLSCEAEYYIRNYPQNNFHRYDDQQNYMVTVARSLNSFLEVGLQYQLVVNDSTVALYQYSRNIFSMLATARF